MAEKRAYFLMIFMFQKAFIAFTLDIYSGDNNMATQWKESVLMETTESWNLSDNVTVAPDSNPFNTDTILEENTTSIVGEKYSIVNGSTTTESAELIERIPVGEIPEKADVNETFRIHTDPWPESGVLMTSVTPSPAVQSSSVTPTPTSSPEPCPIGCRCTAPPRVEQRHYWHRLLAQYRLRKLIYGYRPEGYGFKSGSIRKRPFKGREMICVGLKDIPDYIPSGVSKVTIYGKLRETWEYQEEEAFLNDQGVRDDDPSNRMSHVNLNQITSVSKLNVIPSAGMKRLWVEGNRIKVLHPTDFTMLEKLRYLHIRNNRLRLLSVGAFHSLKDILEIDLSENHLKSVLKTTFLGLRQLRKVTLAKNRLASFHSRTFADLIYLEYLDLSYNLLTDLPADIFKNNELLRNLDLSYNNLNSLKEEWFLNLSSLQKLFLRGNQFYHIPAHAFSPLGGNLTHINLDKNQIREITQTSFAGLENLMHLRLQHNNISFVEDGSFTNLTSLKDLHLDYNSIDYISINLFNGLLDLTTLTLSHNKIKGVSPKVFENFQRLEKLDLSNNFIQTIHHRNFFGLLELRLLRLDHNQISNIEEDGFAVSVAPNFSKLTWLYLNFNEIAALTGKSFNGLCYLKMLNLGHNKIDLIDDHTFTMMNKLNTLILSSNQIPYLRPAIFRKLNSLRHMNLGSNLLESLEDDVFYGLTWIEDLSLQNNEISFFNNDIFLDTPKLNSLNLKKNKLKTVDLDIVDAAVQLRYLDLGQNHLTDLLLPTFAKRVLNSLSLADNSFQTLSSNITHVMAYKGKLHLYGNPWSCDCNLDWILDDGWSHDSKTGFDHKAVLVGKEEIECKQPTHLTGERINRLEHDLMVCTNETQDASRDAVDNLMMADQNTESKQLGCSFSPIYRSLDFHSNESRHYKEEPLQWVVTIYDEKMNRLCRGVRVGIKHILTPTHCWKDINVNKVIVQLGSANKAKKWFKADFGTVEHFTGALDYSLLRIQRPEVALTSRIFPCLLNKYGFSQARHEKPQVVISTAMQTIQGKTKLKPFIGQVITEPCVENMLCLQFSRARYNLTAYENDQMPIFIKVGKSRWSLAGFGDVKRFGNILVTPLTDLINWSYRLIR